jgi:cell division protein FtsW (lipid II flippase)/cell division protein FtsI/penicillin-binding protein 2
MAITRSWETSVSVGKPVRVPTSPERRREFPLLLVAAILVGSGLALVYSAKTQPFNDFQSRLDKGELLNLNAPTTLDQVTRFFPNVSDPERIEDYLNTARPLPNDGALAKLHKLQLAKVKPSLVVRTPSQFRMEYLKWCGLYMLSFWFVHFVWQATRFRGDPAILPALHLLSGMGLILAVSLRDPLRDTLEFQKFAWGAALGCVLLLLPLFRFFQVRQFAHWVYTPLLISFLLFAALLIKGSGPTGSDAKVNLGPFQPVELIKVLLVFFLAGYFAKRWEWLRELHEKRMLPGWMKWPEMPRFSHVLPVIAGVSIALALFFVLKDMGPALVIGFLFLSMFAIARGRSGLAILGVTLLVAGVVVGYKVGAPHTVVDRINMWLSPWDNNLRGGDQIAHSLWALSTGGAWGSGPGMGDPGMIPAGHTDLVLSSIGEEWGFLGVLTIFTLFLILVASAFRIARRATNDYAAFLAFGLGALVALEMLLVSAGVLDAIPLSGVVSPFLSSGNTAMLANFLIFAILLGISNNETAPIEDSPSFSQPIKIAGWVFAALAVVLVGRDAYFQVIADREYLIHDVRVFAEDGVKRPEYNPRLNSLMRQIPRGDIYDRNGILLATSSWRQLEQHREDYQNLGISIENVCSRLETRHYPFGSLTTQFLGDLRTGDNFHATNSSLIEHDSNPHLQGYSSLTELAPAVRYRHYANDPNVRKLLDRNRDLKTSLDIRLQSRLAATVQHRVVEAGTKGAAIVLDAHSGDVLAMVSAPDQMLDRARYGQYPPGSTFKLVTAMAALNLNPQSTKQTYACTRLPDGRAGTMIRGWNRPIRDDIKDHPHGSLNMKQAITVSCNAYFAQLGVFTVGSTALRKMTESVEMQPGDAKNFKQMLPFAAYGQGPVLTTPFKMARVAATIADGGEMPQGRWVIDSSNSRNNGPRRIVSQETANFLADAMRNVVTNGTGRQAMSGLNITVAGKTGTAQVEQGDPHSWFAGFAPYELGQDALSQAADRPDRISFAVVVEHGGYGARAAAPIAREIVEAARDLGIIKAP